MSLVPLLAGLVAGVALGVFGGRDLGVSVYRAAEGGRRWAAAFGLLRRMTLLSVALAGSLYLGSWAWAGLAAGYLAGFAGRVAREVSADVG